MTFRINFPLIILYETPIIFIFLSLFFLLISIAHFFHEHKEFALVPGIQICDRISENGSKSHMKSIVIQHVFNYISTYAYAFLWYLLYNFNNLSIKFHVLL